MLWQRIDFNVNPSVYIVVPAYFGDLDLARSGGLSVAVSDDVDVCEEEEWGVRFDLLRWAIFLV